MAIPFIEIQFLESSEKDNEDLRLGAVFSVSPYRLYQLYLKAIALFHDAGLPVLPEEKVQDSEQEFSIGGGRYKLIPTLHLRPCR